MNSPDNIFEQAVDAHYQNVYRFALSLTRSESEASDLAQATFERLLRKSDQIRDLSGLRAWLLTTLYRLFLEQRRRADRYPHVDVDQIEPPSIESTAEVELDSKSVLQALAQLEEPFRAVVTLFYMEGQSYREIAQILDVPIGTVMSRLSRGKTLLRALLADQTPKIIPLPLRAAL